MPKVKFNISEQDNFYLHLILDRAEALGLIGDGGRQSADMDLVATHSNGCPLDFKRFYEADEFNFLHDFCGIARHIDRRTGKMLRCFSPRFSLKEAA